MFFTYLRRELSGRRRQTAIIAAGMALAIALVIIVNAVAAGVKDAQSQVLASVYGVGTDITVSQTPTAPTAGQRPHFDFGADEGSTTDGTKTLSKSRLTSGPFSATLDQSALATVTSVSNVQAAAAALSLQNVTFSGQMPSRDQAQQGQQPAAPPAGGGSSFDIQSFSVIGLDPAADAVGPLSAVELTDGRGLAASDAGKPNAVVDSTYATTNSLSVGSTLDVGGTTFTVVGLVSSTSGSNSTAANVYIPLDLAQSISGQTAKVSTIYVQANSSTNIDQIKADVAAALPTAKVSTQSDLASSVSGSLATASSMIETLGLWLSVAVLAAAFLIAILFTISGVTRRTREFGTLKAIGWSNSRIVGQVAGESVVQGLIGGVIGVVVGLAGVLVINSLGLTLTGGAGSARPGGGALPAPPAGMMPGGQAGGQGGFGGGMRGFGQALTDITLHAPLGVTIILVAVGLSVAGGLLAGAIGGWRASRLSPAEALRSVN
jgi:putative ABC transport system permease protein